MIAISAHHLKKSFINPNGKVFDALSDVSFEIPQGQIVGFIGANGAGKTTTMRILATIDPATSGSAQIMGYDVISEAQKIHKILGWVPDDFFPFSGMSVLECIDFFARAMGFSKEERLKRLEEVINFTEIGSIADKPANKISKGQMQRLCLARALIHDPEVLILDEPAAGLDPKARVELRNLLLLLAKEGKTIFISSHILSELGETCDNLLFIDNGKIIKQGKSNEIRSHENYSIVSIELLENMSCFETWLQLQPNIELLEITPSIARVKILSSDHEREQTAQFLASIVKNNFPVIEFKSEQRSLEEAFIDIVTKNK